MQPNVLIFISRDTGRHISPYGVDTVCTPNFERLAGESVRFSNAFSCSPQCSPARAALFSGMTPHSVGVMGNVGREHGWRFPDSQRHAARIFGEAGYQSWLVGMLHETYLPETLGFGQMDVGCRLPDAGARLSEWLGTRDKGRPFYCQVGCRETHRPWDRDGASPDESRGVFIPPYLNDGPETRADFAQFQGSVKRLDDGLGDVLGALEEAGVADDTIVIVTTDHGIAVPRAKCTLYDAGTGVFLFVRWPGGGWGGGVVRDDLVSHVDVLPTVLKACGLPIEEQMQGQSFLGLLGVAPCASRRRVFTEKTFFQIYDPMRAVRTERHKYIHNFELCRWSEVGLDCVRSGTVRELGDRYYGGHPAEELYDLAADPHEMTNLAEDPGMAEIKRELQRALGAWMRETGDPLLNGPVRSPYHEREVGKLMGVAR